MAPTTPPPGPGLPEPAQEDPASNVGRYLAELRTHYQTWRQQDLAALRDPEAFLTEQATLMAQRVEDLEPKVAGPDPIGESYLEKVGRLRMARLQALEVARSEFLPPPDDQDHNSDPDMGLDHESTEPPPGEWIPIVEDPDHPWWKAAEQQNREP
jgi:hypothetical protein